MTRKGYTSMIATPIHISESEIAAVYPEYQANWLEDNIEDLKSVLFDLGMDTNQHFELQPVTQHRNRLGKVVTCARYTGEERSDPEYLKSGMASREAKDKAKNSQMLDCLYREKGLTVDAQLAMEKRDMYKTIEEEDKIDW